MGVSVSQTVRLCWGGRWTTPGLGTVREERPSPPQRRAGSGERQARDKAAGSHAGQTDSGQIMLAFVGTVENSGFILSAIGSH